MESRSSEVAWGGRRKGPRVPACERHKAGTCAHTDSMSKAFEPLQRKRWQAWQARRPNCVPPSSTSPISSLLLEVRDTDRGSSREEKPVAFPESTWSPNRVGGCNRSNLCW